jgi:hypothetical protein
MKTIFGQPVSPSYEAGIAYGREMYQGQHTKEEAIATAHSHDNVCDFYEGCGYGLAERGMEDRTKQEGSRA